MSPEATRMAPVAELGAGSELGTVVGDGADVPSTVHWKALSPPVRSMVQ